MRVVKNVIPAKAGIHNCLILLDPRLRGDDKNRIFHNFRYGIVRTEHRSIKNTFLLPFFNVHIIRFLNFH